MSADSRPGELPDVHTVPTRDPLQQEVVRFLMAGDPPHPIAHERKAVGLITLRTCAHKIRIDPQHPIQNDLSWRANSGPWRSVIPRGKLWRSRYSAART